MCVETYVVGFLLALLGTTTKAKHQVQGGLLLDVVVAKSATIFELLASKDQTLLIGGNADINWVKNLCTEALYLTLPCLGSWP